MKSFPSLTSILTLQLLSEVLSFQSPNSFNSDVSALKLNARKNSSFDKNSGANTFVIKKGSNEVKQVMGARKGNDKIFNALGSPLSFKLNAKPLDKSGTDDIPNINTMEVVSGGGGNGKGGGGGDGTGSLNKKINKFLGDVKGKLNIEDKTPPPAPAPIPSANSSTSSSTGTGTGTPDATAKFTFGQKIESTIAGLVGLFAGGIALTPFTALHDIAFPGDIENGFAQFEFDTDTGSIGAALFAIVYRYCVREGEEKNEMLPMGVVGAFVVVRTLGRIRVSNYCDAAPLDCGAPLGYFDWNMLQQAAFSGLESAAMFGAAAYAMEYCYKKGYISRFK